MKYEEAMDRCIVIRDTLMNGTDLSIVANISNIEWITMCAEAMEKQIPKKVINNTDHECFECPACGRMLIWYYAGKKDHCKCGQAISWEEDDDI